MEKLRLKRHGSFYIREGWMEKALNIISKDDDNKSIFRKEVGVANLGIGSMMVTSLRYWMIACEVINEKDNQLTTFGKLLLQKDPYLEDEFSWWMLHEHLVSNFDDAPIFNIVFNYFDKKTFTKEELIDFVASYIKNNNYNCGNEKYIADDIAVLINTYLKEKIKNPEDNKVSPFAKLELLKTNDENGYIFLSPRRDKLTFLPVYYSLVKTLDNKDSINIDDLTQIKNNPMSIFNIDKNTFYLYLDDIKQAGLITLNKTAGLNMIYIQNKIDKNELDKYVFNKHFNKGE